MIDELDQSSELATWINDCLNEAKKHTSKWRKEARECYDFYASKQWQEEAKAQMLAQRKVPVVFNRVARTINATVGLEIQNRQAVQFIPREVGDTKVNELYTSAADWIRDNCDAEDEESEAFQDLMICGVGGTETSIDYEEEKDGKPLIERCDPLELFWDAAARKKNLRDRRWCARVKQASEKEARDIAGDMPLPEKPQQRFLMDDGDPVDATPPRYDGDKPSASQPKTREICHFQWFEKERFYRYVDFDGQEKELTEEQWETAGNLIRQANLPYVAQRKKRYYQAILIDGWVIPQDGEEKSPLLTQSGFTIAFITGARDRNDNTWFGLVSLMMDPQRWANKWLSQIMHILNTSAKGGLIAEKDAFGNPKVAEDTWAMPESITWANPGAVSGGKVQPKPQTPMPDGFAKLLDFAVNSINDVPGVNMELMGLVGTNQPGVLEGMRKQAGMSILAIFFDAIRLYRKENGRILIEIIRDKISDGRLIRVVGKQGAQYVPLMKDPQAKEFDVVVDEAPTSPNNKERVFSMMTQLAPTLQASGIPITPDLLEYSPLPSALVEKWQAFIKENKQIPPEVLAKFDELGKQLQSTQMQAQALAQENFKLKTDASVEVYKINEQSKVDRQIAAVRAETESEKRAVEMYKANLDAMLEKLSLAMDTMTSSMRNASEAHIPRTEQAVGRLGEALGPALQQMLELSMQQTQQIQSLGPALQSLGEQIVQGMRQAMVDNRVVGSDPVYGEGGRMRALKRRYGDGSVDEMPFGQMTVQ